jgi:hypothetical protein
VGSQRRTGEARGGGAGSGRSLELLARGESGRDGERDGEGRQPPGGGARQRKGRGRRGLPVGRTGRVKRCEGERKTRGGRE